MLWLQLANSRKRIEAMLHQQEMITDEVSVADLSSCFRLLNMATLTFTGLSSVLWYCRQEVFIDRQKSARDEEYNIATYCII